MSGVPGTQVEVHWGKPSPARPFGRYRSEETRRKALSGLLSQRDPTLRWRGKIAIPERVPQIVRRIYVEMNRQRATYNEVAKRSGVNLATIKCWRRGTLPNIANLEAVVQALGGSLRITWGARE